MVNLYKIIEKSETYRKLEVNELLFVEYTCTREESKFDMWSNNNYFAFVFSGKKIWRSIYHSYEVSKGEIIFVKKGANLTHQFFDNSFCGIFLFLPDEFIRDFLRRYSFILPKTAVTPSNQDAIIRLESNHLLETYQQSLYAFLNLPNRPNDELLKLKFDELLLSLFTLQIESLTGYFVSLCQKRETQMNLIMEQNFAYNLKIENYAELCSMSLSSFKAAFRKNYNTTPAAWLRERKLELACQKLIRSSLNIGEIAFECGFEDPSHFIRVFKQKHSLTPLQFRQTLLNGHKVNV